MGRQVRQKKKPTETLLSGMTLRLDFSHPDCTVGTGISPVRLFTELAGFTAGMELHHSRSSYWIKAPPRGGKEKAPPSPSAAVEPYRNAFLLPSVAERLLIKLCSYSKNYSMILATAPEPTVRPPSRIAKRRPCSQAMGVMSSTVISTLSPGRHISTPSGRAMVPVTSVVLK